MTGRIALIHLVREANGLGPLRAFLDSLRAYPPGAPHDLVLLLKGFSTEQGSAAHRDLAADLDARHLFVTDEGYDIGAYLTATRRLEHPLLCFVNSFTELRTANWLAHLASALDQPGVGLVGATGSWGSHRSMIRYDMGLGGAYASAFGDRSATHATFASLEAGMPEPSTQAPLRRRLRFASTALRQVIRFEPFPARHLRTNGFLIGRKRMLLLRGAIPRDKLDAYALESGRRCLTRQVERLGLDVRVVGADGRPYAWEHWPESRTFWQGDQENLLMHDNQTRIYRDGSSHLRLALARYAWGGEAQPELSRS